MTDNEKMDCSFNFTKELSAGEEDKRFVFVLINAYDERFSFLVKNFTEYEYQPFYYFNISEYSAFQGFVLFDDWSDDCYLESVSRVDPFFFADESQILALKHGTIKLQNESHPCLWQFKAPKGYGFKMFLTEFIKDNVTRFSISNSDYAIANEKDVKTNFPYYSYNNYLKVTAFFEKGHLSEFTAYISIFKLQFNVIDGDCTIITSERNTTWTNILENSGYLNNAKCLYKNVIKPFTETRVTANIMNVEDLVDHVYFYFNGYDNLPTDISGLSSTDSISLFPYSDNTERTVLWEFKSDGSIQSLGFSLIFEEISCSCNNSIIIVPCEGTFSISLMNRTDGYYCGNLECNFTIILDQKCNKTEIIQMQIFLLPEESDISDIFRITADNITVLEINNQNHYYVHTMFLYSNSINVFQALTATNLYEKTMEIHLKVIGVPTDVSTIVLTKDKPYFAYNLCENVSPNVFNIELSHDFEPQNVSIEIFSSYENFETTVLFFNNQSLTQKLNFKNCVNIDKSSCNTFKIAFSIFHFNSNYLCIFPRYLLFQSTSHTEGCVFKNNIFNMANHQPEMPIIVSAMSNAKKSCRIFVFPYLLINQINSIFTTPNIDGSLKIYVGSENKEFAIIDNHLTSSWYDIRLNSDFYIFELPINAAIAIYIGIPFHIEVSNFPYSSVFASPHFGESKMNLSITKNSEKPYITYSFNEYDVKFTLTVYNVDPQIQYYFIFGKNERINITANFGTKIFSKTDVKIYIECISNCTCNGYHDILFHIESLAKIETTSSLLPDTTTSTEVVTNPKASEASSFVFPFQTWILFIFYFLQIFKK